MEASPARDGEAGAPRLEALAGGSGSSAVAELRAGRRFRGRYACTRKDRLTARNGSPYLSLELRDRTGSVPARVFREPDRVGLRFERGDAIEARGRVERRGGELAVELDDARRLEPREYDPAEFLPAAYRSVEELEGFLEHLSREIHDSPLRSAVGALLFCDPVASDFRRAPCTRDGHHAYLGGLLEHTVSVATLVGELCQLHPRLDSDLLMAAALVHDVGRTREFTYGARDRHQRGGSSAGTSDDRRGDGRAGGGVARARAAAGAAPLRAQPITAAPGEPSPRGGAGGGRGFASAEALALYRLNALDAGVKGALERGPLAGRG